MTEQFEETRPEGPTPQNPGPSVPVDPGQELAHANTVFGWALFGLFLVLFAGTWVVAFIYLALA